MSDKVDPLAERLSIVPHVPCGSCRSCLGIREEGMPCYQGEPDFPALAAEARRYFEERLGRQTLAELIHRMTCQTGSVLGAHADYHQEHDFNVADAIRALLQ